MGVSAEGYLPASTKVKDIVKFLTKERTTTYTVHRILRDKRLPNTAQIIIEFKEHYGENILYVHTNAPGPLGPMTDIDLRATCNAQEPQQIIKSIVERFGGFFRGQDYSNYMEPIYKGESL